MILNDNYHDTYWQNAKYNIPKMDPNAFLKAVYGSMKPGAVIAVIDHVANPNDDTRATVEKLHRIDPNVVKADFKRAGFVFVKSSDVLQAILPTITVCSSSIRRSAGRLTSSSSSSGSRVEQQAGRAQREEERARLPRLLGARRAHCRSCRG